MLCDCRADAEALSLNFQIRMRGVIDVQVAHAALNDEVRRPARDRPVRALPFFFPTGLARLVRAHGGSATRSDGSATGGGGADGPLDLMKAEFGEQFEAQSRPFRTLPLSRRAATYAASDVWHIWLVHSKVWPRILKRKLGTFVQRVSELRLDEFRDNPGGKDKWKARLKEARMARGARAGGKRLVEVEGANPPKRPRVVSGPLCDCCGIRFSSKTQLDEHRGGKRHKLAESVAAMALAPPLAIECRKGPLEIGELKAVLAEFGHLGSVSSVNTEAEGPWRALVEFASAEAAAKAIGQKAIHVGGKRVYVETS